MIHRDYTEAVETGATTLAGLLTWLQFQPHEVLQQEISIRTEEGDEPWNGVIRFEGIGAVFVTDMTKTQAAIAEAARHAVEWQEAADRFRLQTENLSEEERRLLP